MLEKKKVDLLLINPPFHMRNGSGKFFPLGLRYIISSVEHNGYSWAVIDCTEIIQSYRDDDLNKLSRELKRLLTGYAPLIIGIGPTITSQLRALKIISSACRDVFENTPIFAGGPFASIKNQEWFFFEELKIEYLIKGDGEVAVPDVIRTLKKSGEIKNCKMVSSKDVSVINVIEDINQITFPYRGPLSNEKYSLRRQNLYQVQAPMITSRGCPFACDYCVSGNMKNSNIRFRKRTIQNVLEEIVSLHNNYGVTDLIFYDDCFFHNLNNLNEDVERFCKALINNRITIKWQIEMRPDFFVRLSEDAISYLNAAGCRQINLGIEKVTDQGLAFIGKKGNWSGLNKRIDYIRSHTSISQSATFIIGGGEETASEIKRHIEETLSLGLDFAHYNPLFIYPGTPLYNLKFSNEREWADYIMNDELPWGEIVYESRDVNKNDLLELIEYAYTQFYKNTSYKESRMVKDRFNIR